jgi:uncharacterized protein (TIGR02118 family)
MTAHLIVMYPQPRDPKAFDRAYREEHLPYAGPRLAGAMSIVSKRVAGPAPYYAMSDIHFPSLEALQKSAASNGAKEALAHAASISTGGAPVVLVVTDDLAS